MADYKAIHGKNIQSLASELGAEGEGQIWFNTTSGDYKTIVLAAGAWSTGGNANTDRWNLGSLGIQTAAIMFGGQNPDPVDLTETYDGSTWTATHNTPFTIKEGASSGPATEGDFSGGNPNAVKDNTATLFHNQLFT